MSIIDHTLNKYDIRFRVYLDLVPLSLVYFVMENVKYILENTISVAVEPCKRFELNHVLTYDTY